MESERQPRNLDYAGKLRPQRRLDPGIAAFFCGLIFLPSFVVTGWRSLHGELDPLGVLMWLAIGIVTTCFFAAAWEQRTWLGARTRLGRAGTVLTVFGWILGCMTVLGPRHDPHDSDLRRQVKCASNLRQIGQAILLYANDHGGQYPERPDELLSVGVDPEIFVCPSTGDLPAKGPTSRDIDDAFASGGHLSFVYIAKGLTTDKVGAQHVLAFEPMRNHATDHPGIHVLFGDGRIEFLQDDMAQRLTERLRLGENPPTGWR